MIKQSPRYLAMTLLYRMEKDDAYSNIVLDSLLKKTTLEPRDRDFITRLFYGVLERKLTLDYIVSKYIKRDNMKDKVRIILRMAFYELLYLNAEDYAVTNEYVNLTKAAGFKNAASFVNAVVRSFIRDDKQVQWPKKTDDQVSYLKTLYSCSSWIASGLINDYGFETACSFLKSQVDKPPITIRVNTEKTSSTELIIKLEQDGVETQISEVPNYLSVKSGNVIKTKAFEEGLFHVQDVSSGLCSLVVSSLKPSTVLDVCSAPGGKTFTIAQETKAEVLACDLYPKRVGLIEKGAKKLGVSNVDTLVHDATTPLEKEFDVVLCDVPCSGFGVIRRKPEIKYKKKKDISELSKVQNAIIREACNSVKPGGFLVYSTCTIRKSENEDVVGSFLSDNGEFEVYPLPEFIKDYFESSSDMLTILPGKLDCDGFFLTVLRRKV